MGYSAFRKVIDKACKRAQITKRHNPHLLFRKSRASFLSDFLNERQLMAVGGWKDHDSVTFYIAQKDTKKVLKKIFGEGEEEKTQESLLKPKKCEICGASGLQPTAVECSKCFNPLTLKEAILRQQNLKHKEVEARVNESVVIELLEEIRKLRQTQESHEKLLVKLISKEKAIAILGKTIEQ